MQHPIIRMHGALVADNQNLAPSSTPIIGLCHCTRHARDCISGAMTLSMNLPGISDRGRLRRYE